MQWLREEFLPYLERWEESVSKREGYSKVEEKMMLLSQETRNGLRITGMCDVIIHTHIIKCYLERLVQMQLVSCVFPT